MKKWSEAKIAQYIALGRKKKSSISNKSKSAKRKKNKKKVYKERLGGGAIPFGDGRNNPASMVDAETGYAIGDPFPYGRKRGRSDPKQLARNSHLYGMPSTIFVGALNGNNNDRFLLEAKEEMISKIKLFKAGKENYFEIHAKTIDGAKELARNITANKNIKYKHKNKSDYAEFPLGYDICTVEIIPVRAGYQLQLVRKKSKKKQRQLNKELKILEQGRPKPTKEKALKSYKPSPTIKEQILINKSQKLPLEFTYQPVNVNKLPKKKVFQDYNVIGNRLIHKHAGGKYEYNIDQITEILNQ